jgi:DNA-binding response OmpR family regulator
MLTARDGEIDRVLGPEMGADDCVTKQVLPEGARGRVGSSCAGPTADRGATVLVAGDVEIDLGRREVRAAASRRSRPPGSSTCAPTAENRGLALSRRQLLDGVWGVDWIGDERTVDVHGPSSASWGCRPSGVSATDSTEPAPDDAESPCSAP